ncbi:MAG: hypothetical protein GKR90_24325 [Pseudomonadales bacterium]|nr:hypothetical protein [Pseudomonadales bacterium]
MRCLAGNAIVGLTTILFMSSLAGAESQPEHDAVSGFHDHLLEMARLDSQIEREKFVDAAVADLFDVERITKVSVGRTWRTLDEAVRLNLIEVVGDLIVGTYARRFDADRGQKFQVLDTERVRRGIVVRTEIKPKGGEAVSLDYFFQNGKVFNVAADGVSDLSLRRADYGSVVKSDGIEGLMSHLESKLQEMRAE